MNNLDQLSDHNLQGSQLLTKTDNFLKGEIFINMAYQIEINDVQVVIYNDDLPTVLFYFYFFRVFVYCLCYTEERF